MQKVTAVFDIGKTNKKFFLFNAALTICYQVQAELALTQDEDGHPCESIEELTTWVKTTFADALQRKEFVIEALNFSAYGASFVHIDHAGKPMPPLYNYTKPFPNTLRQKFYTLYGPKLDFSSNTGSFDAGMLNSGMQLFWLKHQHPNRFKNVKRSLHLPQYLSFIFSQQTVSDYTSIGCHTALWDYQKKRYHLWVKQEGLTSLLPPIVDTKTTTMKRIQGKDIKVGVGVHDSSAALIPYLKGFSEPFMLLSTGTWNVVLNPFASSQLNKKETIKGGLYYMQTDGSPVKAARLFLGYEHEHQVKQLNQRFGVSPHHHKTIPFSPMVYQKLKKGPNPQFEWIGLSRKSKKTTPLSYSTFEEAYHHLMIALVARQVESIQLAQGEMYIKQLFVEGGFSNNKIFLKLLCLSLPTMEIYSSQLAQGSALGAVLLAGTTSLPQAFLTSDNQLTKQETPALP